MSEIEIRVGNVLVRRRCNGFVNICVRDGIDNSNQVITLDIHGTASLRVALDSLKRLCKQPDGQDD